MLVFCKEIVHREWKNGEEVFKVIEHRYEDPLIKGDYFSNFYLTSTYTETVKYNTLNEAIDHILKILK